MPSCSKAFRLKLAHLMSSKGDYDGVQVALAGCDDIDVYRTRTCGPNAYPASGSALYRQRRGGLCIQVIEAFEFVCVAFFIHFHSHF